MKVTKGAKITNGTCQICGFHLTTDKSRHIRGHNMTIDDYEVVVRDPIALQKARRDEGLTDITGQCYYCSKVCKNLGALRNHQNLCCRPKGKGQSSTSGHGENSASTSQPVIIDGGVISDDSDDDNELPTLPPPPLIPAPRPTTNDLEAMKIKLKQMRSKNSKLKAELREIKNKYIQLLEQNRK